MPTVHWDEGGGGGMGRGLRGGVRLASGTETTQPWHHVYIDGCPLSSVALDRCPHVRHKPNRAFPWKKKESKNMTDITLTDIIKALLF